MTETAAESAPPAVSRRSLGSRPATERLAIGLFCLSILGFYALAQVQLAYVVGGGEVLPGPQKALLHFYGDRTKSRFHKVLDKSLAENDSKNMWKKLVEMDAAKADERRTRLLRWAEAGAPATGWPDVAGILTPDEGCAKCHSARPKPEDPASLREKYDLPFDTPEQAAAAAAPDTGTSPGALAETSHNHAFGFTVLALLSSLLFAGTRWRGPIVPLLIVSATVGAVADIGAWWLTHAHGSPWHLVTFAGGAVFGVAVLAMTALVLDEVWLSGRVGSVVSLATKALRLGRQDPA